MTPFVGTPTKAVVLTLALVGAVALAPHQALQAETPPVLADMDAGGVELFKQVVPSVIQVFTGGSAGSGYFIDKGGYAITNRHVTGTKTSSFTGSELSVQEEFEITLYNGMDQQQRWKGTLIGSDPALDFSLLKVDAPEELIVPIKLADTALMETGDMVATCGSPGGQAGLTNASDTRDGWLDYFNFNLGLLTEIIPMDRCLIVFGDLYQHESFVDLFQADYGTAVQYLFHVDAAINHGNSGGPCVNSRGEAIGTNTWGFGGENHGMTVPVNLLTRSAREILQYGRVKRPWLGISLHDPHASKKEESNADRGLGKLSYVPLDPTPDAMVIQNINKYSPAASYLREGDIIVSIDGRRYTNIFDYYKYILNKYPGDKVTIQIQRNGIGLPPITIELAEKKNRFTSTHIYAQGGPWGVQTAAGGSAFGSGVVGVTY